MDIAEQSFVATHVECDSCGMRLLAFESRGPEPIAYEECPDCGGESFSFVE